MRGRKKCASCGKRYNWYYSKSDEGMKKVKFKGKEENSCLATSAKVLSANSCEVTVNCPECGAEEKIIYTE
jgi:DNA-directed RNA polymerase subunit RPC12/RpoP